MTGKATGLQAAAHVCSRAVDKLLIYRNPLPTFTPPPQCGGKRTLWSGAGTDVLGHQGLTLSASTGSLAAPLHTRWEEQNLS